MAKWSVSIEIPEDLLVPRGQFKEKLDELLVPFAARFRDIRPWSTGGQGSYLVWFESEKPDLASVLQQALITGEIWMYSVRIFKQTEQEVRLQAKPETEVL